MEGFELVGWKAWYFVNDKIVTYTSDKVTWDNLPQHGIQFVKKFWYDKDRIQNQIIPVNVTGQDVFSLTNDTLQTAILTLQPNDKRLKLGVLLSAQDFGMIFKEAKADEEIVKVMI